MNTEYTNQANIYALGSTQIRPEQEPVGNIDELLREISRLDPAINGLT